MNLGDSYSTGSGGDGTTSAKQRSNNGSQIAPRAPVDGIPPKNLLGMPWRVAFALQDAGWILRSDIIWSKPNPMPESVRDRPTRAHEYVFMFAKKPRYFYDATAISEASIRAGDVPGGGNGYTQHDTGHNRDGLSANGQKPVAPTRNRRSVWTIATQPYSGAHFATMPEALIEPCILAGSASQACEHCGAAWARVVEHRDPIASESVTTGGATDQRNDRAAIREDTGRAAGGASLAVHRIGTDRFIPSCRCDANTGSARSVVLDPFAGSGTVMRVAERFGRDAIGIDLSYQELQEQRTNGVQTELFR
ncbi:MAG TPA: site-specific DNA-methyltransferase [Burkholderiales bacterium]|nr:site-specific DNA-methyltransferase [Burkholderiales bacterium]